MVFIASQIRAMIILVLLFEYVRISDAARTVIQSVWQPIRSILTSFVLILAMIMLFSIIVFQFFHKDFFENELVCQTLFFCLIECINYGMRNGGGVGDSLYAHSYESHKSEWQARTVMDLSFFLLVNIILLNVVFGIIIDTFGMFRDEKLEKMKDKEDVCYVCGKHRSEISQYVDYTDHITAQHGVMSYWHFILYLKQKKKLETGLKSLKKKTNDMTGLQHYVLTYAEANDTRWLPIGQSLAFALEKKKQEQEDGKAKSRG